MFGFCSCLSWSGCIRGGLSREATHSDILSCTEVCGFSCSRQIPLHVYVAFILHTGVDCICRTSLQIQLIADLLRIGILNLSTGFFVWRCNFQVVQFLTQLVQGLKMPSKAACFQNLKAFPWNFRKPLEFELWSVNRHNFWIEINVQCPVEESTVCPLSEFMLCESTSWMWSKCPNGIFVEFVFIVGKEDLRPFWVWLIWGSSLAPRFSISREVIAVENSPMIHTLQLSRWVTEVAEHIPPEHEGQFLQNLGRGRQGCFLEQPELLQCLEVTLFCHFANKSAAKTAWLVYIQPSTGCVYRNHCHLKYCDISCSEVFVCFWQCSSGLLLYCSLND